MSLYETFKRNLNEAIEQKYRKSNDSYGKFLRDVKQYTGSYDYLYGGKINTEYNGQPIIVEYFYYNRPFVGGGYNLVTNVLTPMDYLGGDSIQETIDNAFEKNSKSQLSNKEIKEKILSILSGLNEKEEIKEGTLEPEYSGRKSFYGKAYVDDNDNTLVSYGTPIMRITDGKIEMLCKPEHLTQTTLRHIREFMQQNGMDPIPKNKLIKMIEEPVKESEENFDLPEGYPQEVYDEYFKYCKDIDLVEDEPLDFNAWYEKIFNTKDNEESKAQLEAEEKDTDDNDLYNNLLQKINAAFKELTGDNLPKHNIYLILPEDNEKADKYELCNKRYNIGIGGKDNPYIKALKNIGATNIKVNNLGNIEFDLASLNESVSINGINYYKVLDESGEEYYSIDPESITVAEYKEDISDDRFWELVDDYEAGRKTREEIEEILTKEISDDATREATMSEIFNESAEAEDKWEVKVKGDDGYISEFFNSKEEAIKSAKKDIPSYYEVEILSPEKSTLIKIKQMDGGYSYTGNKDALSAILDESESLKESSNIIWSTEITEDNFDDAVMKEDYDEYVNSFEAYEDEYGNHIEEPKDFDEWKENYIIDHSDTEWELLEEDFLENICPMIDKQINNDILIVSGNYNSNYPDFRPSGPGGKFLNKAEDILDWLSNEDRVDITNTDGIVGVAAYDHDGSIGGNLYTLPDDKELLYEIAMKTDYYDSDRDKEDVLGEFSYDLNHGNIDMSDLRDYADKFVPIKVEW